MKLDICYYSRWSDVSAADAAWICAIFVILVIGTHLAHMEEEANRSSSAATAEDDSSSEDLPRCSEDGVGVVFYHVACRLIPDVITIASQESVQACLLLAKYALPLDTQGLD